MISRTKYFLICVFFLSVAYNFAQKNDSLSVNLDEGKSSFLYSKENQKTFSTHINYRRPIASESNFLSEAYQSTGGYDLKMQIYPYKNFFIGGALAYSFFEVTDNTLVGNYSRTTIREAFLFAGYEFIPLKNTLVGLNVSFASDVTLKNNIIDSDRFQRDFGKIQNYGVYFAYEFSNNFAVYIDYSYRIVSTSINAPLSLNGFFDQGTYHNIGIGLKFSAGNKDLFSLFSNAGSWFKREDGL